MPSLEYLSGFIDGEGSLSLSRIPRSGGYREYCLRISIANTNRQILEEIQDEYGGTLAGAGKGHPKWKPSYALIWTNAAAARLLAAVAPHLRVKEGHATALLEFVDHLSRCQRRRDTKGRLLPLSRGEIRIREAFYKRLKRLNLRGRNSAYSKASGKRTPDSPFERKGRISPAYLAGFIDGEGSLTIAKTHLRKQGTPEYRPRLALSSTFERILSQIRRGYGGLLYRYRNANVGWKDSCLLIWTEGMLPAILSQVRPHLRIKQRQADIILDLIRHVRETPMNRKGKFWIPHPKNVVDFRERLYQRVKALNARGVKPADT